MESFKNNCIRFAPYIGGGIVAMVGTAIVYRHWKHGKRKRIPRVCGKDYPKDTVIVHGFGRGRFAPSLGHFVIKLGTYLRITKIPHEPFYDVLAGYRGPKQKSPWIEYNGLEMGDSQLIINYLNKEFNVDLNKHLTSRERATAWAIQKWLEEFTYWLNVRSRWYIYMDDFYHEYITLPSFMKGAVKKRLDQMAYTVGVGRHSNEEVDEMFKHDLMMLSELLGDKKFLTGDQPAEVDCAAFGQLSQILYHTPDSCPGKVLLKESLHNLTAYCDRIKTLYWPDWDQCITGKTSH